MFESDLHSAKPKLGDFNMILRSALRSYASELLGAGTEYKFVPAHTEAGGSATSAGQESVLKTEGWRWGLEGSVATRVATLRASSFTEHAPT